MMNPFLGITDIQKLTSFEFESTCRTHCSFARLDGTRGLARILTRYKMFVDVGDVSLVPHLIMDGFWETPVTQCLSRIVKEGDICIDVGAHMGYFSVLMSALSGDKGRTIAVEPNPAIVGLLRMTSEINHPGFEVWEGALSDATKETQIHIPKSKTGDSSLLVRASSAGEGLSHQTILATTMDQLLQNLNIHRVNVIKIDAEGAEPLIFDGMTEVLLQNPELKIVMEYSPHLYPDVDKFNRTLLKRFYLYRISVAFSLERIEAVKLSELGSLKSHVDLLLVPVGSPKPF